MPRKSETETTVFLHPAGILAKVCRSHGGLRWRIWDVLVGIAAFWVGFASSPYHEARLPAFYYIVLVGGLYGVILMVTVRFCGVPRPERTQSYYEVLSASLLAIVVAYAAINVIAGLVLVRTYGRYIVAGMTATSFAGIVFPRLAVTLLLSADPWHVLAYGAGVKGRDFADRLANSRQFQIVGFLDSREEVARTKVCNSRVWGTARGTPVETLIAKGVDLIVICARESLSREEMRALLHIHTSGIPILTKASFFEYYLREISLDYTDIHWFADTPLLWGRGPRLAMKRTIDVAVSLVGLIWTSPAWVVAAAMIKLTSPGPVLYRQERVGKGGRVFTMIKFRSMKVDAEEDGAQWATKNDPRISWFGRIMRVTRWDELPQFINVLRGDMSLVGPRPERPEFVREFEETIPLYAERHILRPGLTGWAQVRYQYAASKEDTERKLQYDLYYCRRASLLFDLEILLRTIPMVMKGSR